MNQWQCGAATDTGLLRTQNEDRYWIDEARGVFLVADGVGGHAAGDIAAQTAVDVIREHLVDTEGTPSHRVRRAITAANNRIFEVAEESDDLRGMACVLTLALVEGDRITIGHVGDSRMYLFWNGSIRKLTSDHSPVGEVEDAGGMSEEEAMYHPRRNEVFRDVGTRFRNLDDDDFIEVRECRFKPDAAILLCSDGLTDHLTSAQLRGIIGGYNGDAPAVAMQLIEAANEAGGRDNITALFVAGPDFCGGPTRQSTTRIRYGGPSFDLFSSGTLLRGRLAYLIYGLVLGIVVWAFLRGGVR
jgi:serine/threonine protein phosphatase PrpC